jgi:cytochrome c-type biogenesis protein CcmH
MSFWLLAALLAFVSVCFVIWPVLMEAMVNNRGNESAQDRKDVLLDVFNERRQELNAQLAREEITSDEYTQITKELEQVLLSDSEIAESKKFSGKGWPLLVGALLAVTGSYLFYFSSGAVDEVDVQLLLDKRYQQQISAMQTGQQPSDEVSKELLAKLLDVVGAKPNDEQSRYLLARLAAETGGYGLAVLHYTHLLQNGESIVESAKQKSRLMAELAQVVFLASGNVITPEVSVLTEKSLEINPLESTALGLSGIESYEKNDFLGAISFWQRAVDVLGANSPVGQGLVAGIARAQSQLGVTSESNVLALSTDVSTDGITASAIEVTVSLAPGVSIAATDTVLIYARAWQGAKMPLAIKRFNGSELPLTTVLDKTLAMAPGMDIHSASELEVIVRISKSGDAVPAAGDWQSNFGPVTLVEGMNKIALVVENQLP